VWVAQEMGRRGGDIGTCTQEAGTEDLSQVGRGLKVIRPRDGGLTYGIFERRHVQGGK